VVNHTVCVNARREKSISMWSLFKDKNEINEKNIVGFASFVVMCLFAVADLVTSFVFVDGELVINEVIYNSFVWVTLGCFGISSFERIKRKL
jgi:hypothetical protein